MLQNEIDNPKKASENGFNASIIGKRQSIKSNNKSISSIP